LRGLLHEEEELFGVEVGFLQQAASVQIHQALLSRLRSGR